MTRLGSVLLLFALAAGAQRPPLQKAQRLPMQKRNLTFKSPADYEKRILRHDPKTKEPIYYDPKPQVMLLDAKSGKYALKWIGYDGREKMIIFQRADAIDAVVSASVSKTASGLYLYTYKIENLPSSGTQLSYFVIQTFARTVTPIPIGNGYVGQMSKNKEMKLGDWIGFGSSNFISAVTPGKSVELKLFSSSPPSLVECRLAGGALRLKGVGEEMPQELENVLPSYEDWPSGYTIGPVEAQKALSSTQRADHILKLLPQFQRLGWMPSGSLPWYEQRLKRGDLSGVTTQAEQDLKAGKITTEVHDMIQAIRQ